ncbi:MAG: ORC1-type DNA replication protein [Candidatus Woesearchaeota archaeon]
MQEKGLVGFFEKYLDRKSIFKNKSVLQSNFNPTNIQHREDQINNIATILAPCLRGEKPSNVFIYGKTGTGKTLIVKHTIDQLSLVATGRQVPVVPLYINCKMHKVADTQYRLIAHITREKFNENLPITGLPTQEIYAAFLRGADSKKQILLLVLDEIDQLMDKEGDDLLYNLTRINTELKNAQLSIIGISNNANFINTLDPRVKSSLSQEELFFPPYNALQIQDILKQRAEEAFLKGAISQGVIEKCAAFAARDHGDARRAIELLRVAAELAERSGSLKVTTDHLDQAESKIETDRIFEIIKTQPQQYQLALLAIYSICSKKQEQVFTGEVYDLYQSLCSRVGLRPLTQRRISDIVGELDMLGIINAKVISKGRYGRTREISISTTDELTPRILQTLTEEFSITSPNES